MDFDFSDDQQQLRDAVRKWAGKAYPFERRRSIAQAGGFSHEAYREMAALGLCGIYVPEQAGGLGMGPVEAMVVMEELGSAIVLEPLVQALIAGALLATYAPAGQADPSLSAIACGESIVVLAYQERAARYRLDVCATRADRTATGWALHGAKSMVCVADHAHAFLVPATVNGVLALFLVQRDATGVRTRGYGTIDGGRAGELELDGAPAQLLCTHAAAALAHAVDIGIAATCAEAVGAMDKIMALTVEYMHTRKQFGVPISSFQALRHRVADMKMQLELARSMSYYASLKLNAPAPERRCAMARAKWQLGNSMRFVGQQAIQLHGGVGVTDEYAVAHYFKRLTQMEMSFGDSLHHLGEVSDRLQDNAGVFT